MTNYTWLLFDADNTLFDFDAAEEFALTRTLLRFGLPAQPEVKARYRSINSALWKEFDQGAITQEQLVLERFSRFFTAMGISGDPQQWNDFYLDALSGCPTLLPGAEALCRKLSQRYTLALITNSVPFVIRRRLSASPLERFFGPRVFISGEMGCRKPEKAFFDKVLTALGAQRQKGQVLVIGDGLNSDILGAFNSRLDSVWLHRPGVPSGAMRPTYAVGSLAQLEQLLTPDPFAFILS